MIFLLLIKNYRIIYNFINSIFGGKLVGMVWKNHLRIQITNCGTPEF